MKLTFSLLASIALVLVCPGFAADKSDALTIDVPSEVKAAIYKETGGASVLDLNRSDEDGTLYFVASVKIDGSEYTIRVNNRGVLDRMELKEEHPDEGEPRLDSFPPNVKSALQKHIHGATIDRAEKQTQELTYSVVIVQSGSKYRISVNEAGKLLRKEHLDE